MTTIDKVYCRPKNVDEWVNVSTTYNVISIGFGRFRKNRVVFKVGMYIHPHDENECYLTDMTEIPVQHFIDLLEDRIVPWRLDEIGFGKPIDGYQSFSSNEFSIHVYHGAINTAVTMVIGLSDIELNIKTFTELLQLLKLLGHDK